MPTEPEIIADLISALETDQFELLTLYSRLTGEFQRNVKDAAEKGKLALQNAREFYDKERSSDA